MDTDQVALGLRPEIAQSWTRSSVSGLTPTSFSPACDSEVDVDSRLARAAFPVIDHLCEQVGSSRVAFMLTDKSARLIKTAHADPGLVGSLNDIGAIVGSTWTEDRTGTNALATPFETRQPIFIHGHEHFVDPMKDFSCYGAPIFNPVTGRLEGVLDIMTDRAAENALMVPVVSRAVAQIQDVLRADHTRDATLLLAKFERTVGDSMDAVVAVGPAMVLQNAAATQILATVDLDELRSLASETTQLPATATTMHTLENGIQAELMIDHVSPAVGAVITVRLADRAFVPRKVIARQVFQEMNEFVSTVRRQRGSVVVTGEPGTGRTTVARAIASGETFEEISALWADDDEVQSAIRSRLLHDVRTLVIENVEALSPRGQELLADAVSHSSSRIVATCDPSRLHGPHLLARFKHRIDLRPLRELRDDFVGITRTIRPNGVAFQFDVAAIKALTSYTWPGNLVELGSVLDALIPIAKTRVIRLSDLPLHVRRSAGKSLTPWQSAARDAIIHALELSHDNKSHAAEYLGISRTSLYHHMREYGLLSGPRGG